jgi:hypothetical protein
MAFGLGQTQGDMYYDLIGSVDDRTKGYRLYVHVEEDGDMFRVGRVDLAQGCPEDPRYS